MAQLASRDNMERNDDGLEIRYSLPDYLNNSLPAAEREQVARQLARDPHAQVDLANLDLILQEMDAIERMVPQPDDQGLEQFLAHARSNPLPRSPERTKNAPRFFSGWLRPALGLALAIIVGQGVFIGHLIQEEPGNRSATRSLSTEQGSNAHARPLLSIHIAPEATFADVMAVIREVDGKVVYASGESNMLYVELAGTPVQEAKQRLKQSRLVVAVIEIPRGQTRP
jgi:anti-sigma factor RsiW